MIVKEGNGFITDYAKIVFVQIGPNEFKLFSDKSPTNRFSDTVFYFGQEFDIEECCEEHAMGLISSFTVIPAFSLPSERTLRYTIAHDKETDTWHWWLYDWNTLIDYFGGYESFKEAESTVESHSEGLK